MSPKRSWALPGGSPVLCSLSLMVDLPVCRLPPPACAPDDRGNYSVTFHLLCGNLHFESVHVPPMRLLSTTSRPTAKVAMSLRRVFSLTLAVSSLALSPLAFAPAAQAAVVKPLDVVSIKYDPPGRDYQTNANINNEYLVVKNVSASTLTIGGYKIRDAQGHTFTFPTGTKIGAGRQIVIRSGKGPNSAGVLYWQQSNYVWNNTGDTLTLTNAKGTVLERCSYKGGGVTASC